MLAYIARYNTPTLNVLLNINPITHWKGSINNRTLNILATTTKVIDDDLLVFLLNHGCLVNIKPFLSLDCSYPLIIKHEQHKRSITMEEITIAVQCDVETIKTVFTRLGSSRGEIIRKCMQYNRVDAITHLQLTDRMLYSNLYMLSDIGKDVIPLIPNNKLFELCKHAIEHNRYKLVGSLLHILSKKSITKLFQHACNKGSVWIVKLLMPHAQVSANNNIALTHIIQSVGDDCGLLDNYSVQLCANNIHILELLSYKPLPCLSKLAKYCDYTDVLDKFIERDDAYLVHLASQQCISDVTYLAYKAFQSASEKCFTILIKNDNCNLKTLVELISANYSMYATDYRYYDVVKTLISTRGIIIPQDLLLSISRHYPDLMYFI